MNVARSEAERAGVSRLADITRLDILGIAVWQAIRPWSRSVSVHQGKGLDSVAARIGACIEAIECDWAERWADPDPLRAPFGALPRQNRAVSIDDFAQKRDGLDPEDKLDWSLAKAFGNGNDLWVPTLAVSLDLTVKGAEEVERSSNGQGGGIDLAGASLKGLCELIERDAFQAWSERAMPGRAADIIDSESIEYSWFRTLQGRWRELGVVIRAFRMPALINAPAIAVELYQLGDESACRARAVGTCVHPEPERALLGAVLEAAQARLGEIAGSREDIDPDRPETEPGRINFAPPAPSGKAVIAFHRIWQESRPIDAETRLMTMVQALSRAGYPRIARIELSPAQSAIKVVKLFAPGLGALGRSRRDPLH